MRKSDGEVRAVDPQFAGRLTRLASAPADVFWRECFLRGAYTRDRSLEAVRALGARADACGRTYGREMRPEGKSAAALCAENGLEIRELAMPETPEMEIFALFEPPSRIYVRTALLSGCDRFIKESGVDAVLGQFRCMDVVLLHEFFHFLETRDSGTIFTWTYRESRGLFRRKMRLPPLAEIAAMGFAQEMLGLAWSPFLLDCVMLCVDDGASALAMLERLERFAAESAGGFLA